MAYADTSGLELLDGSVRLAGPVWFLFSPPLERSQTIVAAPIEVACYSGMLSVEASQSLPLVLDRLLASGQQLRCCGIALEPPYMSDRRGPQTLQLCTRSFAVVIQRDSGLLSSPVLRSFLRNWLRRSPGPHDPPPFSSTSSAAPLVFVGADLAEASLALLHDGLALIGALDLTPILSQYWSMPAKSSPITAASPTPDRPSHCYSLASLFNRAFGVELQAVPARTDWSRSPLSALLVKQAVLHAWASLRLGEFVLDACGYVGVLNRVWASSLIATPWLSPLAIPSPTSPTSSSSASLSSPNTAAASTTPGLLSLLQQAAGLDELSRTEEAVEVKNLACYANDTSALDVACRVYANKLRTGSIVRIRVFSHGGCKTGVVVVGTVLAVKGRVATVKLRPGPVPTPPFSQLCDTRIVSYLNHGVSAARAIVDLWREEENRYGAYTNNQHERHELARVRIFSEDADPDAQLAQVSWTIAEFVRRHTVGSAFFAGVASSTLLLPSSRYPPSTAAVLSSMHVERAMRLLLGIPFLNEAGELRESFLQPAAAAASSGSSSSAASAPSAKLDSLSADLRTAVSFHKRFLNSDQFQALVNATACGVSAIRGPPGTGKTRTIAAIAEAHTSVVAGDLYQQQPRVLILAPANAAARRVLESTLSAGFTDVCLIVASEYFFEWHEGIYAQDLSSYVHTKEYFLDGGGEGGSSGGRRRRNRNKWAGGNNHPSQGYGDRDGGGGGGSGSSSAHAHRFSVDARVRAVFDFRPRLAKPHNGRWTSAAMGERHASLPRVVITTYGCAANALCGGVLLGSEDQRSVPWKQQVQNLIQLKSITNLVVDETSQLWAGFALGLLSRFPALQRLVLVGDEHQLPPYGEDRTPGVKSLFDLAVAHPSVPTVTLSRSYRLPACIAELISSRVYGGALSCVRDTQNDRKFLTLVNRTLNTAVGMKRQLEKRSATSAAASFLLRRLVAQKPHSQLAWVHHSTPMHANEETFSSGNYEEARFVAGVAVDLILALEKEYRPTHGPRPRVIILSGYVEQNKLIEIELARLFTFARGNRVAAVDFVASAKLVNTVDGFQGQEADIVIVSTVRSGSTERAMRGGIGFAADQRRANVLLSRARQLLVIVGDGEFLVANGIAKQAQMFAPSSSSFSSSSSSSSSSAAVAAFSSSSSSLIGSEDPPLLLLPSFAAHASRIGAMFAPYSNSDLRLKPHALNSHPACDGAGDGDAYGSSSSDSDAGNGTSNARVVGFRDDEDMGGRGEYSSSSTSRGGGGSSRLPRGVVFRDDEDISGSSSSQLNANTIVIRKRNNADYNSGGSAAVAPRARKRARGDFDGDCGAPASPTVQFTVTMTGQSNLRVSKRQRRGSIVAGSSSQPQRPSSHPPFRAVSPVPAPFTFGGPPQPFFSPFQQSNTTVAALFPPITSPSAAAAAAVAAAAAAPAHFPPLTAGAAPFSWGIQPPLPLQKPYDDSSSSSSSAIVSFASLPPAAALSSTPSGSISKRTDKLLQSVLVGRGRTHAAAKRLAELRDASFCTSSSTAAAATAAAMGAGSTSSSSSFSSAPLLPLPSSVVSSTTFYSRVRALLEGDPHRCESLEVLGLVLPTPQRPAFNGSFLRQMDAMPGAHLEQLPDSSWWLFLDDNDGGSAAAAAGGGAGAHHRSRASIDSDMELGDVSNSNSSSGWVGASASPSFMHVVPQDAAAAAASALAQASQPNPFSLPSFYSPPPMLPSSSAATAAAASAGAPSTAAADAASSRMRDLRLAVAKFGVSRPELDVYKFDDIKTVELIQQHLPQLLIGPLESARSQLEAAFSPTTKCAVVRQLLRDGCDNRSQQRKLTGKQRRKLKRKQKMQGERIGIHGNSVRDFLVKEGFPMPRSKKGRVRAAITALANEPGSGFVVSSTSASAAWIVTQAV